MIRQFENILNQIRTWPRAMQWSFWAATLTIGFLVWDSTIADLSAKWSVQADSYEAQIAEINRPTTLTSGVKNAIKTFGAVELPRSKTEGATAMTEAVHSILRNNNVRNDEYTRTKSTKMRAGSMPGIGGAGKTVEQVIGDIRFEATQEDILKVISALESSKWIDTVSDIRLARQDGRMIRVDLSVEAWVIATAQKRGSR